MSERAAFKAAAARYDAQLPPVEQDNPDCPECGTTMEGDGDRQQWNFDCPKCGCNVSGDNFDAGD